MKLTFSGNARMTMSPSWPHVVIIGGGFGGLYAAKVLGRAPVRVTLVDRRNFHLFQPLLYQVATGGLSPGDIASPLRAVLNRYKNIEVQLAEVVDVLPDERKVVLSDGELDYDMLIIATGVSHHYFGHEEWAKVAPGLKTIEDALEIRRRIFLAFEAAEREPDPDMRRAWMTFVIVGGGPTGVELAGAIGELAHGTLKHDFRRIDPREAQILLIEGAPRILPGYPESLSHKAAQSLERLGVTVKTQTLVTKVEEHVVHVRAGEQEQAIPTRTVLWAAGVKATEMAEILKQRTGAQVDRTGRVIVEPDLSLANHPEIFVIGDLAHYAHQTGEPLPAVAPVAMQQGRYVARLIRRRLQGKSAPPFRYRDKGSLAVIGRNRAVAFFGKWRLSGFFAWILWVFVHLRYLIEFDNKVLVMFQWAWYYLTRKRGARLITGKVRFPLVSNVRLRPKQKQLPSMHE